MLFTVNEYSSFRQNSVIASFRQNPTGKRWVNCLLLCCVQLWKRGFPKTFAHFVLFCPIKSVLFNRLRVLTRKLFSWTVKYAIIFITLLHQTVVSWTWHCEADGALELATTYLNVSKHKRISTDHTNRNTCGSFWGRNLWSRDTGLPEKRLYNRRTCPHRDL